MSEDTPGYEVTENAAPAPEPRTLEQVVKDLREARQARDAAQERISAARETMIDAQKAHREAEIRIAQIESELATAK